MISMDDARRCEGARRMGAAQHNGPQIKRPCDIPDLYRVIIISRCFGIYADASVSVFVSRCAHSAQLSVGTVRREKRSKGKEKKSTLAKRDGGGLK